jgi:integrase
VLRGSLGTLLDLSYHLFLVQGQVRAEATPDFEARRERTNRRGLRRPATTNRYLGALSHAMGVAAREWMWLDASPLPRVSRPRELRGRVRFLSESERSALLDACARSRDSRLLPLAVLALSTGARLSELTGLRWADVDLDRRMAILQETKNGDRRSLALAGRALELLTAMHAARVPDGCSSSSATPAGPSFHGRPGTTLSPRPGCTTFAFTTSAIQPRAISR